jgi:hypothetical protein
MEDPMTTVRIWSLEPDYDAEAIERLADKLVTPSQLGNLSIQASDRNALPRHESNGAPSSNTLRKAVQHYLKQDACVIFFTDRDSPTSIHQRCGKTDSLIKQIEHVANDSSFDGKIFFTRTVHELEACLPIVCKSFAATSTTWEEEWESTLAHFHKAFADTPEDQLIKEFDAILAEVRNERT